MLSSLPSFVVVGAGGLGCPAMLGLCDAGARELQIWDPDRVDASNLQRQILYDIGDVGRPKSDAAAERLRQRYPGVAVTPHVAAIEPESVDAFVGQLPEATIVLECTDQSAAKFAFNDAALRVGVPLVIGAALDVRTQAIAVRAGQACYRCFYETVPSHVRGCGDAGVLGPAVGLGGYLMAHLSVALATGQFDVAGSLFAIDVWAGKTTVLNPAPRIGCPACAHAKVLEEPHSVSL